MFQCKRPKNIDKRKSREREKVINWRHNWPVTDRKIPSDEGSSFESRILYTTC